jgi:ABC-type branched-subunit amino acid transport system substrate-binding protein
VKSHGCGRALGWSLVLSAAVALGGAGCGFGDRDDGAGAGAGGLWEPGDPCDPTHNVKPKGLNRCAVMRGFEGRHYVALSVPYTGARAHLGAMLEPPLVLAVTEANANGGSKGACIGVVRCDNESKADPVGAANLDELGGIPEVAYVYSGSTRTLGEDALSKLAQYEKVASYMDGGQADHLASEGFYFIGYPGAQAATISGAGMYYDAGDQQATRVACYFSTHSQAVLAGIQQGYGALRAANGVSTAPELEVFVMSDLSGNVATHAQSHGVDLLYTSGTKEEILAIIDQAATIGYLPKGWWTQTNPARVMDTPHDAYRAILRGIELKDTATTQPFHDNFAAAFTQDPVPDASEVAYDYACAGLLAMTAASEPTDGPSVRDAMTTVFQGTVTATLCGEAIAKLNEGATAVPYTGPSGLTGFADGVGQGHRATVFTWDSATGEKTERFCFRMIDQVPCD